MSQVRKDTWWKDETIRDDFNQTELELVLVKKELKEVKEENTLLRAELCNLKTKE